MRNSILHNSYIHCFYLSLMDFTQIAKNGCPNSYGRRCIMECSNRIVEFCNHTVELSSNCGCLCEHPKTFQLILLFIMFCCDSAAEFFQFIMYTDGCPSETTQNNRPYIEAVYTGYHSLMTTAQDACKIPLLVQMIKG